MFCRLFFLIFFLTTFSGYYAISGVFQYKKKAAKICVSAKSGSTSFLGALYEALTDQEYPSSEKSNPHQCGKGNCCGPVMHQMRCGWKNIDGFNWYDSTPRKDDHNFSYSVMMMREPLLRVISAWQSKVRPYFCVEGGVRDGGTSFCGRHHFAGFIEDLESKICPSNHHFDTQYSQCGKPDDYRDVYELGINATEFTPLSRALDLKVNITLPHRHESQPQNLAEPEAKAKKTYLSTAQVKPVVEAIYRIYENDYRYYRFPKNLTADINHVKDVFSSTRYECFAGKK